MIRLWKPRVSVNVITVRLSGTCGFELELVQFKSFNFSLVGDYDGLTFLMRRYLLHDILWEPYLCKQ